jgi:hypothetical protein
MSDSWQAGESVTVSTTDRYVSTVEWGEFAMPQFLYLFDNNTPTFGVSAGTSIVPNRL